MAPIWSDWSDEWHPASDGPNPAEPYRFSKGSHRVTAKSAALLR